MTDICLKCHCGKVQGIAHDITAETGNRVICYCNDCQAFAEFLGDNNIILDNDGGTDIFQTTHAQVKITQGTEHIRCMRLSTKGLFRWYTACCKTPIGNTVSAGVPFIGLIHNFMNIEGTSDSQLGPVRGYVFVKHAKPTLVIERKKFGFPLRAILRTVMKIVVWKIKGLNKPSPLFDNTGKPISEPQVLNN